MGGAKHEWRFDPLPPGREYDDIPISLVHWWSNRKTHRPLDLTVGKYTVRVAFAALATAKDGGKSVRAVSNPVEIEIPTRQAEPNRESKPLAIDLIFAEGNLRETPSFWIGYEQLDKEALRERAARRIEASGELKVVVRADRAMPHKHVAELLDLLKAVGAKNVSVAVFPLCSVFAIDPGPGRDGTIRGKVIGPEKRGEPGNYVVMLDHEAWTNNLGELPNMEVAAGETFEFRNVPAGKCKVRAQSVTASGQDTGVAAKTAEVEVIVKNKQVVEVELEIVAPGNTDTAEPDTEGKKDPAKRTAAPGKTTVRGKVVDDATGKPVADFFTQGGKFDPADPAEVVWGYSETRSSRKSGQFSATVRWPEGWTARIVAAGYLPQPVLIEPPPAGRDVIEVVIRLKRGDTIRGRVLDHTGKPVAKAGVYLAGRGVINLAEGPWGEFQGPSVRTDAEGRFEIGGRGEDSKAIFVTGPSLYVWRADLPEPGQEATIRLPEPAKLHIRYDIEGGPPAARVRIELRTWDMPKWNALVDVVRWVEVKAGEDGLVVNNLPPGVYDISRIKHTSAGNSGKDMMLDRQLELTLASGKTTAYNFVRETGTPISGDVAGLPKEGVSGVFVSVRDQRVSGDPRARDEWKLRTFDGLSLQGNGSFQTERIPPGKYQVVVEAYKQETPEEMSLSGWRLPKWMGTADVDVPESGEPPKVRLMMRPYEAH
ncbi:MAG: biopolymer transporter ExbD [Planctomycetes bacterium]|nr:biopolymer transporter ExbD [Planctomycetota bacterium]